MILNLIKKPYLKQMMYQFQNKNQINKKKKTIRTIIGFAVFFVLSALGVMTYLGYTFNYIGNPIWKAEKFISDGLYNTNYIFRSKATISKENHNLIEEINYLRLSMVDYQVLKDEVNQLKEIIGRTKENNNLLLGNILTKPNQSPYDTIIIDVGKNLGIKDGDLIYANGNIPIGNISNTYDKTSLVTLFTSPTQKTEGFINETNASVTLIGRGGGNFEMIIPIELTVESGTLIYLPGYTSLVIAQVDEVISEPTDPFKKVILSSPVNIQNLKWVQVEKD